jgi:aspartate/glutamate racemase
MKTIGLIGGMSWLSSLEYYRIINETVKNKLGGLHSAKIVMASLDFAEIEVLQHAGRWTDATDIMIDAAPNSWSSARIPCIRWRKTSRRASGSLSSTSPM